MLYEDFPETVSTTAPSRLLALASGASAPMGWGKDGVIDAEARADVH